MLPDLPELVLHLICGHLSYEDMLRLRITCKSLKQFVDQKECTKLHLFVQKRPYNYELFYTSDLIGYPYSCQSDDLSIFASSRFRSRFSEVQRMIICGIGQLYFWGQKKGEPFDGLNLENLNHFQRLIHLEFDEMQFMKSNCLTGKLSLPELRIASFTPLPGSEFSFELDCPKLRALRLNWCNPVLSKETNQLDTLEAHVEERKDYLIKHTANLEKLSTICFYDIRGTLELIHDLETNQLSLPGLTEIRLKHCGRLFPEELVELPRKLEELEDFKKDPKKNAQMASIKFTFNGKLIDSLQELRQIISVINSFDYRNDDHFVILHADTLSFLDRNPTLHFLLSVVHTVKLSKNIELNEHTIRGLKNVKSLIFKKQCKPNESVFELFAIHCKFLRELTLYDKNVSEQLLQVFAIHLMNLQSICFETCSIESIKPLAAFQNLEKVSLDFEPERAELHFVYKNNPQLEEIHIFFTDPPKRTISDDTDFNLIKDTLIDLERTKSKIHKISFMIRGGRLYKAEFDTLDAMIDCYQRAAYDS